MKRWTSLLVLSLSIMAAPAPAHAEEKISTEARGYFRNGVELLQTDPPNYQDAYYQFKLAFEKSQSWKVLGNLGLCAVKLERDGEALAFYDEYLRRGGKQIDKEEREAIERDMLLIKGNGATLELTAKVQNLKIQDSRSGSTIAAQSHEMTDGKKTLFVRAGLHRITVTGSDGRSLVWETSVEPGSSVSHDFDFDAKVAAPPVEAGSQPAQPPSASEPPAHAAKSGHNSTLTTLGFVAGGVGILTVGGGVVTGLMAQSKENEAKDSCAPDRTCPPSAQPLFQDASSLAKTANVLYIAGGSLAAVGIGLVIIGYSSGGSSDEQARSRVTLVPLLAGNGGGVLASGTF